MTVPTADLCPWLVRQRAEAASRSQGPCSPLQTDGCQIELLAALSDAHLPKTEAGPVVSCGRPQRRLHSCCFSRAAMRLQDIRLGHGCHANLRAAARLDNVACATLSECDCERLSVGWEAGTAWMQLHQHVRVSLRFRACPHARWSPWCVSGSRALTKGLTAKVER